MNHTYMIIPIMLLALAGCSSQKPQTSSVVSATGSDRDEHGCIASAGYSWCAINGKCERPWELAERAGIENSADAFKAFCSSETLE